MKKTLIAALVATTIIGGIVESKVSATERSVLEIGPAPKIELLATPKAELASNSLINRPSFLEFTLKLQMFNEQKRLEEEKARIEAERIAEEEARKAEEEKRLELERQASVGFDSMDVTRPSNITAYELETVLYNTTNGEGLAPYASYFIEAEQTYGINAFFICALAAQESGWGRYAAGNGTNLTGYAVYNYGYEGTTFEGGIRHNILATAELIADKYVNPEGPYHTEWTGYNYGKSIYEINVRYCLKSDMQTTDFGWSDNIGRIAYMLEDVYHSIR